MSEVLLCVMLSAADGYCIRYLFGAFAVPRRDLAGCGRHAIGAVWFLYQMLCHLAAPETFSSSPANLLIYILVLLAFSCAWYRGGFVLKLFLVLQFAAVHELAVWGANSLLWIAGRLIDLLCAALARNVISAQTLVVGVRVIATASIAFIVLVREALTLGILRRIVRSYRLKMRFAQEAVFCLLPAAVAVLTSSLIRLLMITVQNGRTVTLFDTQPLLYLILPLISLTLLASIVFSFETFQNMLEAQQSRAEKAVLENQIVMLQSSLAETERRYQGVRALRHDIGNHMMVLERMLRQDRGAQDELRQYFDGLSAAAGQLDSRVRTGSMVADAVVSAKFRCAEKEIPGIRLDADDLLLPRTVPVKAYDIGVILSNGLDNAVEACRRLRRAAPDADAYIIVRSYTKGKMLFIEIRNSFDGRIRTDPDTGYPCSAKARPEAHGIGLRNIRDCAIKYGGDVDWAARDGEFRLSVMLKSGTAP